MEKLIKNSWVRLTVESVAIIASILLAFGIDAWWSDRQQRVEEHLILAELLEEFQEKKISLDERTNFNYTILETTKLLLTLSGNLDRKLTIEEMDRHLHGINWFDPGDRFGTSVVQSLVSSGDLSIISNPSLRTSLAKWVPKFDLIKGYLKSDQEYFTRVLEPFLINNTNMTQFYSSAQGVPGQPESSRQFIDVPNSIDITDHRPLLDDQVFENILLTRAESINDILTVGFHDVDLQLDATIRMIETELAK